MSDTGNQVSRWTVASLPRFDLAKPEPLTGGIILVGPEVSVGAEVVDAAAYDALDERLHREWDGWEAKYQARLRDIEAMTGELKSAFTLLRELDVWAWELAEMLHRRDGVIWPGASQHIDPFEECDAILCRETRALHLRVEELVP